MNLLEPDELANRFVQLIGRELNAIGVKRVTFETLSEALFATAIGIVTQARDRGEASKAAARALLSSCGGIQTLADLEHVEAEALAAVTREADAARVELRLRLPPERPRAEEARKRFRVFDGGKATPKT